MTPTETKPETLAETYARGQATLKRLQGDVSANDLVDQPKPVNITPVGEPKQPDVSGRVRNVDGFIRSTSDNAKKLAEKEADFQLFVGESSGFDIQQQQLERFGVTPEKLKRLEDIQLQLSERGTESAVTQSRIQSAPGQTLGQAQREVTQEQREEAIRSAGLAAEAAVLQGNIETGRTLAKDAVTIALADREFKANAKLKNIQDLKEVVNEETRQLLVKEERFYQEEQRKIQEIKESVENAMVNGASQDEMAFMTDPDTPDDVKLRVAKAITARGANQMRNLEIQKANASIASSYASAAASRASAARANAELRALQNPDPSALPASTLKAIEGLSDGQREGIRNARHTVAQIERMEQLIVEAGDMALLTKATPEGREFLQIRADVTDKLARERTGAVVGKDEEATFKDILGIGMFDLISRDDDEVLKGLGTFKSVHEEALFLDDPTGEIRAALDSQTIDTESSNQIDAQWGVSTDTTINPANYF